MCDIENNMVKGEFEEGQWPDPMDEKIDSLRINRELRILAKFLDGLSIDEHFYISASLQIDFSSARTTCLKIFEKQLRTEK